MLTTIWICTQEWSLICIRATALTFETCHQALSCGSSLTRSRTRRSLRLPRSGRRMRMPVIASAGVSRVSRTASARDGAFDALLDLGVERVTGSAVSSRSSGDRHAGHRSHAAPHPSDGIVEPRELAASVSERLAEPGPVVGVVEPRARTRGVGQWDHDRVVERGSSCRRSR